VDLKWVWWVRRLCTSEKKAAKALEIILENAYFLAILELLPDQNLPVGPV